MKNYNWPPEWVPDWFNLKNYAAVPSMTIHDWAAALHVRNYIASDLSEALDPHEVRLQNLILIAKNPEAGWNILEDVQKAPNTPTVQSLTIGMAGKVWGRIIRESAAVEFQHELTAPDPVHPKEPVLQARFEQLTNTKFDEHQVAALSPQSRTQPSFIWDGLGFAIVDFTAPDELLLKHFQEWLKETRGLFGTTNPPKEFTKLDLLNWSKKRVLPYLDLTIWAQLTNKKITLTEIGTVLFPDERNGSVNLNDRIRKTVKPLAEQLISETFVKAMSA